jgi:hypothetical protein
MAKHELQFHTSSYILSNGKEYTPPLHDDVRIELIIKELMSIYKREDKRPLGCNDLPYGFNDYILEAIGYLEKAIEWPGDIEDSYGEPPITMDEMHTAAWKEHQEAHR